MSTSKRKITVNIGDGIVFGNKKIPIIAGPNGVESKNLMVIISKFLVKNKISDSQSGYTAMNSKVLNTLDWRLMYTRYGQPNHLLIMLNVYNFRVRDVPVKPIYGIGEKSGIKVKKVIFTLSWLLFKNFLWRMKEKYLIRDFHPLVFFYFLGFSFSGLTIILFARLFSRWWLFGSIPPINALAAMFAFMSASLFTLFAMWFDMEENKDLK